MCVRACVRASINRKFYPNSAVMFFDTINNNRQKRYFICNNSHMKNINTFTLFYSYLYTSHTNVVNIYNYYNI